MQFLAPWFLLGGLAVAVPLVLHLIRHQQRDRIPFGSLMFLKASPPPVQRKKRLENWPLLLLRCLILLLLALAFARPYFSDPPTSSTSGGMGRRVLFLIDTSASMRRGNLLDQAKSRVREAVRKMSSADSAALAVFDGSFRVIQPWTRDSGPLQASLATIDPTFAATHLGDAMIRASEFAIAGDATNDLAETTIQVFSDFQQGLRLDGLQGYAWPRQVRFQLMAVSDQAKDNAHWTLQPPSENSTNRMPALRLVNEAGGSLTSFQIRWEKAGQSVGQQLGVSVPAGQARTVSIPLEIGADSAILAGESVLFDNTAFIAPMRARVASVAFFGVQNAADPSGLYFFLDRALIPTPRLEVRLRSGKGLAPDDKVQWMVVSSGLSGEQAKEVRKRVLEGSHLLWLAAEAADLAGLDGVLDAPPNPDPAPRATEEALIGQVDYDHPFFAMFRDARFNDFTKIRFWKHLRLTMPESGGPRVLMRFDDGSPALSEWHVGRGQVSLLASDWMPAHSQLALSSKFVPMLFAMIETALDADPDQSSLPSQAFVGDVLSIPKGSDRISGPAGKSKPLGVDRRFQPSTPGVYQFIGLTNGVLGECAVNIDPAESRLAPLATNTWSSLRIPTVEAGGNIAQAEQHRLQRETAVAQERRQHWWQLLLFIVLLLGLTESFWAAWVGSRTQEKPMVTI